jgi:hypothetical protein
MPINGFWQTALYAGTINTSYSFSSQHNFGSPLTLWSAPYLQQVNSGSNGDVTLNVSQFKDNNGTHNGTFSPGIFAANCTSVTFYMFTDDCVATAALTTMIF